MADCEKTGQELTTEKDSAKKTKDTPERGRDTSRLADVDDITTGIKNCSIGVSKRKAANTDGLVRMMDDGHIDFATAPVSSFIRINKTLTLQEYVTWENTIKSWKKYEMNIALDYENGSSYTYLLMDPRITRNLPDRSHLYQSVNRIKLWNTFISSIFYIGKGSSYRPSTHLRKALKIGQDTKVTKIKKIWNIWNADKNVVCLELYHHADTKAAYIHEAAMITAIGLSNLTNIKSGRIKFTAIENWEKSDIQKLGCHLLYRAMEMYLNEGERQLKRPDLNRAMKVCLNDGERQLKRPDLNRTISDETIRIVTSEIHSGFDVLRACLLFVFVLILFLITDVIISFYVIFFFFFFFTDNSPIHNIIFI